MIVILGLGFTGARLARRLLAQGFEVHAAARETGRFADLVAAGLRLCDLPSAVSELPGNARLAHLIPPLPEPENEALRSLIASLAPERVVYISSTGVYGGRTEVDETTPADPNDERGRRRMEEERWISSGPWSSLILRAAAIYGPGRGVHAAVRQGRMPRGTGSGVVSRIHVDDLAAITASGLFSELQGAWPVADDLPCSSLEIVRWCAAQLQVDLPTGADSDTARFTGRRVSGREIRERLGIRLEHPNWQQGIQACWDLEGTTECTKP